MMGAADALLVSEQLLVKRRLDLDPQLDALMEQARSQNAKVMVVSGHTEAGKKLEGLGGIAALLRFKVN